MIPPTPTDAGRLHAEMLRLHTEMVALDQAASDKRSELFVVLRSLTATSRYTQQTLSLDLGRSPSWVYRVLAKERGTSTTKPAPPTPPVSIRDEEPEF